MRVRPPVSGSSGDGSPMQGWPLMPIASSFAFAAVTVIELMSPA